MKTKVNFDKRVFRSTPCGFTRRNQRSPCQSFHRVALVILILAYLATGFATASEQPQELSGSFQVPRSDLDKAEALASQLAALSPRVDRNEAKLLADCAYATVSQLRRKYSMFGTPIFNNFLIYHGLKKRGYCYQWSEDLLIALDALKLASLELRQRTAIPERHHVGLLAPSRTPVFPPSCGRCRSLRGESRVRALRPRQISSPEFFRR